jgi:hypothetical protein
MFHELNNLALARLGLNLLFKRNGLWILVGNIDEFFWTWLCSGMKMKRIYAPIFVEVRNVERQNIEFRMADIKMQTSLTNRLTFAVDT